MEGENDILIRLYGMRHEEHAANVARLEEEGIVIKRMMAVNTDEVLAFIGENFPPCWCGEARFAMMHRNCFIAVKGTRLVGFCCISATAPEFLGPIGVIPEARGKGVARALAYRSLCAMKEMGFKYAVGGMVRADFARNLKRNFDVIEIPGSIGSYEDMIDTSIV